MMNSFPSRLGAGLALVLSALWTSSAIGQTGDAGDPPATSEPAQPPQDEAEPGPQAPPTEAKKQPKSEAPKRYTSKSWGSRLETEPPGYVKTLDKLAPGLEEFDWFYFGLEHRTRWEYRDDDYRRDRLEDDNQFLMRSRAYLGIKEVLDPFRFTIEFQDSRQFNSDYPDDVRDVDEADFIQMYGELFFKDALGKGQPLSFRAGRMTLEYVDRKWVGRNRWRNTTNAFDGFLLRMGEPASDWQFDFFAAMPVERRLRQPDRSDEERWFYGLVGAWRKWSNVVTIEPYYFILDEDRKDGVDNDREIHTMGVRLFGPIGETGFDYDVNNAFQFGEDGARDQCAYALYSELGYTFKHDWKPRLSVTAAYATGDRDPEDDDSERVFRLFDPAHPWSTWDYFTWQNMISPKIRLELQPHKNLRLDASYGAYWLASDNDAWVVPRRSDPTGQSGDYVGQEFDVRARWQVDPRVELELGYAYFIPGDFVKNTGDADDGDFFYVQTTIGLYPK